MAELPIVPKEIPNLGPVLAFGNPDRGIQGTHLYIKPEAIKKYKEHVFDGKKLKEFSLFDAQAAADTGLDSARIKMRVYPNNKADGQTELRANPATGETIPLTNTWGVRMMDDHAEFVDIPIEDLTTEKPQPKPRKPKEGVITVTTKAREELEKIRVGSADATPQDNISESDDGATPGLLHLNEKTTQKTTTPIDRPQDNISESDDGVTPGIFHAEPPTSTSTITPEPEKTIPSAPSEVIPTPGTEPTTSTSETTTPPSPPEATPTATPTPEAPRENVVTIVGIQEAFKRRATDFAKEALEKSRNIVKKFFGERFEERYYQHFRKMLEAAQNPFARESIAIAQQRAKTRYDAEMNGRNGLSRAARKTWDRIKEYTFGTTTLERYAVEEISAMQQAGQIREQASFDQEMQAFVERFEKPFEESDTAIRQQLGERLEILNPDNTEHKPLIDGIKGLIKEYRDGTIPDAKVLNERLHVLYETTISPGRQDLLGEAETYASSLAVVAKDMKDRLNHGVSLATLDGELEAMQVRLGIGQMGEATEINATSTHKTVEWMKKTARNLEKRGIIHNVVLNEFTVGSAVSAVLALKMIPQMAASASARMWIGGGAGAVVTGAISTGREFGKRQGELRRIVAQKEAGIQTPDTAKQRQWYETFNFQLRTTKDLIDCMQSPILDADGQMKSTVTIDDLRKSAANLADAKARSAISQREHNRFGLINIGAVGEQEKNRTALVQSMIKTETNLKTYLTEHRLDQDVINLIGPTRTVEQYLDSLTTAQTQILNEGNQVLTNLNDTYIRTALDPLKAYTPEVDVMRRTLGLAGKAESKGKESGLDALLKEFKKQAMVESVRTGVKTASIGFAIGTIGNEVVMDVKHGFGSGAVSSLFMHGPEATGATPILPTTHIETIGSQHIVLGDNMHIDAAGNLDITDGQGHIIHDAIPDFQHHYVNGVLDDFARNKLHDLGLNPSITTQDVQQIIPGTPTEVPGVTQHFQGGESVVDAQGVTHTPDWTLPQGSHLTAVAGDAHTFNLVDSNNEIITSGIHTDATGHITNLSEVQQHLPSNWHLTETASSIQGAPETVIDSTTRTVHVYTDWDDRGDWGWTERQLSGQDITHLNPAVNAITTVWRSYENQIQGSNITFDHTIPGLENVHRAIPLVNGEISANIMPNNSILELPNSLFSNENMAQMAHWSDEAIKMFDAEQLAHPDMKPLQILADIQKTDELHGLILRIGRFSIHELGQDKLSADELQFLMRELAGSHTETATTLLHNVTFTETFAQPITQTVQEHVFTVVEQLANQPEGFIPILPFEVRKGLEPIDMPTVTPPIPPTITPPVTPPITPIPEKGDNDAEKGGTFQSTARVGSPPINMSPPPPPKISEEEERNRKKKKVSVPTSAEVEEETSIPPIGIEPVISKPTPSETTEKTQETPETEEQPIETTIPVVNQTTPSETPTETPSEESLTETVSIPTEKAPTAAPENQVDKPPAGHDVDIPIDQDLQQLINELNGQI